VGSAISRRRNRKLAQGEAGVDEDTWTVSYLIVETRSLWHSKRVLLSPQWIKRVSWNEQELFLDLSVRPILDLPEFEDESASAPDGKAAPRESLKGV
jgi:hypothetical protein